jgi:WD40 repeat protein
MDAVIGETCQGVFVTYSHADLTKVLRVVDCVRQLGFKTWLDTDLRGGEYIFEAVAEAIAQADIYIYVVSPTSVQSYWVRQELNTAKAVEIRTEGRRPMILPVLLEDAELPTMLLGRLGVDLRKLDPSEWQEALRPILKPDDARRIATRRRLDQGELPAGHAPGEQLLSLAHDGGVRGVAFSPDGGRVATANGRAVAQVWPVPTDGDIRPTATRGPRQVPANIRRGPRGLLSVAFRPTGNAVATGGSDNTARVRDLASRRELLRVPHESWVRSVAFRPDGKELASVGEDGVVRIWNVLGRSEVLRIEIGESLTAVDFSADGQRLLTACKNGSATVWDLAACREVLTVRHDHGEVWSAAYAPDDRSIATAGADGSVRVWDLDGGEICRIPGDVEMWCVEFSPDGRSLAMGGQQVSARTWDLTEDRETTHFTHDGVVWAVAFSPDGTRLATGSADGTARIWAV